MRRTFSIYGTVFLLFWILCFPGEVSTTGQEPGHTSMQAPNPPILTKPPIYFIENLGQVELAYEYQLKLPHGNAFYSSDSILYQFVSGSGDSACVENLVIHIAGVDPDAKLIGQHEGQACFNFYRGADPKAWITGARGYRRLVYRNLYPHIDLHVEWLEGSLKHEFHVHPGGRVADITLDYSGIRDMKVDGEGRLEMHTESRVLREDTPFSFQTINGQRIPVDSRYVVQSGHRLTYQVGDYRPDLDLVIDPSLVYSTFLGGSQVDYGSDLVVDLSLNTYIVGTTKSGNFPKTPGAHDQVRVNDEAFLAKLDPTGSDLLFSTYFGGTGRDRGTSIAFSWNDSSPVIAGNTNSNDLPILGGYDTSLGGDSDPFIAKFDEWGTLTASTYFGGSGYDGAGGVSVDGYGFIFLAGQTSSDDFPITPGVIDSEFTPSPVWWESDSNLFITKFNSNLDSLQYSTFYGNYGVWVGGLAVDYEGHAYVAGIVPRGTFPKTPGAYGYYSGDGHVDGFLLKLATDGIAVEYAALVTDGSSFDSVRWVAGLDVDGAGNAYVIGRNRAEPELWWPGFIKKFNSTGSDRLFYAGISPWNFYATYEVHPLAIAVDGRGGVYVTVYTRCTDLYTTEGAFQAAPNGPVDIYLKKLSADDGRTEYATYLGGSGYDSASGIAADSYGSIYVTGSSSSSDFPITPGAYDSSLGGEGDAFIARIRDTGAAGRMELSNTLLKFSMSWESVDTKSKVFFVSNQGSGKMAYLVRPSHTWLTATPLKGECTSERDRIVVTVDPKGLEPGTHFGSVRVYSVDAVNSPQQLRVKFMISGPVTKYDLSIESGTGGTTKPAPGIYSYDEGKVVTLTAKPDPNHRFRGWSGDITSIENPLTITMDSDISITANFIRQYRLTLATGAGGNITPTSGTYVLDVGAEVALTAFPDAQYEFSHWSGDVSRSENPIKITMDSDMSIMANFHRIIFAPSNFAGQKVFNRSLSQAEYINILSWQPNPNNTDIVKYRIYQIEGEARTLLVELSAGTFQHRFRGIEENKLYKYAISAVNNEGREGILAHITVQ